MEGIAVGCGQITWHTGSGQRASEEQVLAEIAQAGYEGAPASPQEDRTTQETLALFARHGLRPAPGYLGADFWKKEQRGSIIERAQRLGAFMAEAGCTELYVAAGGFDHITSSGMTRRQVAGHVSPDDSLSDDDLKRFAETLTAAGEATLREGVWSCFHNHVGSVIETEAEIERILELVDPATVALGPDTGHLAWGGVDVMSFCRRHIDRIKTLHIKDIDKAVMERGRVENWDYNTFSSNGVFAELGEGFIDFPALFALLGETAFKGWVIAETDVTQKASPLESVTISRAYLRSIGV